jgi:hypothetical protein
MSLELGKGESSLLNLASLKSIRTKWFSNINARYSFSMVKAILPEDKFTTLPNHGG